MFKNQKGITLIALVITIIVLLILAGVTIAMLTGSDSAPQKANEAKQKQDIGAAKDQVYIVASDRQTVAYENVYVKYKTADGTGELPKSSNAKKSSIGTFVGTQLPIKLTGSDLSVGNATIAFSTSKPTLPSTVTDVPDPGTSNSDVSQYIQITTTDFATYGWVDTDGGALNWTKAGIVDKP